MKKQATPTLLNVHGDADGASISLGKLSYDARQRSSAFQWSPEAIEAGLEWSPLKLGLQQSLWLSSMAELDLLGLPGLIHDALPDGWGMLLMDRAFGHSGIAPHEISPLLRLAFLANRSWGALSFTPEWGSDVAKHQRLTLDTLAQEAQSVMEGDTERVSEALLMAGGSPQGARPKVMVAINEDASKALVGQEELPEGYRHVLIKFSGENEDPTHPSLEFSYGEAARGLGIQTAQARLLTVAGRPALCVDRFDRQHGQRQHVHSMAGMLHITHRVANADWGHVAHILKTLPGASGDLEEAFDRAVFNTVFCVRDDHTKNIAFIRHPDGSWGLSPAFDIAYSEGPGGYHTLTYARHRGQNVTHADLQRLALEFDVDPCSVAQRVSRAMDARQDMLGHAKGLGVSRRILTIAKQRFPEIDRALKPSSPKRNKTVGR